MTEHSTKPCTLLVDDEPLALLAIEAILQSDDYDIVSASSAKGALQKLKEPREFILALLDVRMPLMDGFSLTQEMKMDKRLALVPVCLLTAGLEDEAEVMLAYRLGVVDIILKSDNPVVLRAKVKAYFDFWNRLRNLTSSGLHNQNEINQQVTKDTASLKTDFLATISHELRTPMNAIMGMSYLAQQTMIDQVSKNQDADLLLKNYLSKISQASRNLLSIINDIMDSQQIETKKLELKLVGFDPKRVIEQVVDILNLKAEDKGLELLFDIDPGLPLVLVGDPLRLGQILLNLGDNAIKFTEKGQIAIVIRRAAHDQVPSQPDDKKIELQFSIKDSGIGMTAEQCEILFQPFGQVDSSITRKYGGTGLGLSIAKSLVELMGGTISVESHPGVGSEFRFYAWFGRATS